MQMHHWARRSILGRCLVWAVILHTVGLQCVPGYLLNALAAEAKAKPAKQKTAAADLPEGLATLGGRIGDQAETFGDLLIPLWAPNGKSLLFLNPRGSATDTGEEEANLGVGFRTLLTLKKYDFILGGNIFYDSRWTQYDSQFDQMGLGVEFLSKWVDARANYYLPDTDKQLADTFTREETTVSKSKSTSSSTRYGDLYPQGNAFYQSARITYKETTITRKTTTTFVFERYEAALEGFDAEIGVKIPGLSDILETRAFVGYQKFDSPFGEDLEGFMGRLELRAMPGLTLDAQVYENDELNGTDYYVGGRVHVPFEVGNIAQGKNPFAGASDNFKKAKAKPLIGRLTEMVIRDVKVRTASEVIEDLERRVTKTETTASTKVVGKRNTRVTALGDVEFVDSGNVDDPLMDGTYEHPKTTITQAVTQVKVNGNIYVEDDGDPYEGNLVLPYGVGVFGSGTSIEGYGGKRYDATTPPVVLGDGTAPVFTMSENSTVAGFFIQNPGGGAGAFGLTAFNPPPTPPITGPVPSPNGLGDYDVSRAGIAAVNVSGLTIRDNFFANVSYGAVIVDTLTDEDDAFVADVIGNDFDVTGAAYDGLVMDTRGASGTFDVFMGDNIFNNNGSHGLFVDARYYDRAFLTIDGADASFNGGSGMYLNMQYNGDVAQLVMRNIDADENDTDGIYIQGVTSYGDATAMFEDVGAYGNYWDGIHFGGGVASLDEGNALLQMTDVGAWYSHMGDGFRFGFGAVTPDGNATVLFRMVDASFNGGHGMYFEDGAVAGYGNATFVVRDAYAWENGYSWEGPTYGSGIYIDGYGSFAVHGEATFAMNRVDASYNCGHGVFVGADAARADYGDAGVLIENSVANDNGSYMGADYWSGFYFGSGLEQETIAHACYGDADTVFYNVIADDNGTYGIFSAGWGAYAAYSGDATLVMDEVETSYNGLGGIHFLGGAMTTGSGLTLGPAVGIPVEFVPSGDATVLMTDITANWNGGEDSGIHFGHAVALAGGGTVNVIPGPAAPNGNGIVPIVGGDATAIFDDIEAMHNAGDGLYLGWLGGAQAFGGNALFQMTDVNAISNGLNGIFFGQIGASALGGDAGFYVGRVNANHNGQSFPGSGITFNLLNFTVAHASGGDATAVFEDVEANHNGLYGIFVFSSGAVASGGDALFEMRDVTASYNMAGGIHITGSGAVAGGGAIIGDPDLKGVLPGPIVGGDATLRMINVTASHNTGLQTGIHFGGFGAQAGGGIGPFPLSTTLLIPGDATVYFQNVAAYGNEGDGIHFGLGIASSGGFLVPPNPFAAAVPAGYGNAEALFDNVEASYNTGYGIYAGPAGGVATYNGWAYLTVTDTEADWNGLDGFFFGGPAVSSVTESDAGARFERVSASHNDGSGFYFASYGAFSGQDDAVVAMLSVDASDNDGHGMYFSLDGAHSVSGSQARVVFDEFTANENDLAGIRFAQSGAHALSGQAYLFMSDGEASGNDQSGISFGGAMANGHLLAIAGLEDVTADGNNWDGIAANYGAFAVEGNAELSMVNVGPNDNLGNGILFGSYAAAADQGDASATFRQVTANANSSGGLVGAGGWVGSSGGVVNVTIRDSEFSGNGFDGLNLNAWGNGGPVNVTIRNTAARTNQYYGIHINAGGTNSPTFNLDVGRAGSSGLNSIQGNGYAGVWNEGAGTATVVNNYWGGGAPVGGTPPAIDYISAGVADPGAAWLAVDPNP